MSVETTAAALASDLVPGEQYAAALANIFKAADDFFMVLNSPAALKARQSADVQAILGKWDADLKAAQATGNLAAIDQEASG